MELTPTRFTRDLIRAIISNERSRGFVSPSFSFCKFNIWVRIFTFLFNGASFLLQGFFFFLSQCVILSNCERAFYVIKPKLKLFLQVKHRTCKSDSKDFKSTNWKCYAARIVEKVSPAAFHFFPFLFYRSVVSAGLLLQR